MKKSGGGIGMGITKSGKSDQKVEPRSRAINPASVSTMGISTPFPKPKLEMGKGYEGGKVGPTGIANAKQGHAGAGPGGGGRVIYRSGSQSPTPPAREIPATKDTLSEYGRDIPGRRR
jgi:hypothetical protein